MAKKKIVPDTSETYNDMLTATQPKVASSLADFYEDEELDGAVDYEFLFGGMPKYTPNNSEPIKQLIVSFNSWEDYDEFSKLLGGILTRKTKSIFFPVREARVLDNYRWVDDGEAADER